MKSEKNTSSKASRSAYCARIFSTAFSESNQKQGKGQFDACFVLIGVFCQMLKLSDLQKYLAFRFEEILSLPIYHCVNVFV